ncbi:MAG: glycosyltransferase family 4 protein [Ignavibacteriales bacterium]|nr:glycosyltransferase family 4 protein [Ignavibacteriales bacterium]
MKRILLVGRYQPGELQNGPGKYTSEMLQADYNGYNVQFVQYFFDGYRYGILKKLFGFEKINTALPCFTLGIIPLIFQVLLFRPHIVHVLNFERFIRIYLSLKKLLRFQLVYTCHGIAGNEDIEKGLTSRSYINQNIKTESKLLAEADAIITFSNVAGRLAKQFYNFVLRNELRMLPGVLDNPNGNISTNTNPKVQKLLCYTGNLNRQLHTLPIVIELAILYPSLQFTVVGSSTNATELPKNIKCIRAMPYPQWLIEIHEHDCFIIAYPNESFSFAALDALTSGLILLAEKNSGIAEHIIHGVNGFLFDSAVKGSASVIINKLLNEPDSVSGISSEAIQTARKFEKFQMLKKTLQLYSDLLRVK